MRSRVSTRPLAKLGKAVKVADASNQRKAKGKTVSAVAVAFREDTKPFDKADIAVAVNGNLYNIKGGNAVPNAPEAVVREADGAEYVFGNWARIAENEQATGAAVVQLEDALCEQDAATEERLTAVEEALCELDSVINGGGEN